jgi:phage-related protein
VPTQAVFYRDRKGGQPVKKFLWTQMSEQARLLVEDQIDELNGRPDNVPPPPFPQTSQIAGGLRELRCHTGSTLYRILYRRSQNLFVLLHVIRKDSRAISRRDVEVAGRRWLDFKDKMDNPDRRGPRPAGQDAP